MAQKMKVTYTDGTETEVLATPKAQLMAERFMRTQGGFTGSTAIEASIRLAFEASKPGIGNVGFEEWLENVADVDAVCSLCGEAMPGDPAEHICPEPEEAAAASDADDPTPEAPSQTPSFD